MDIVKVYDVLIKNNDKYTVVTFQAKNDTEALTLARNKGEVVRILEVRELTSIEPIDYDKQMLNYYPEVIKSIREFKALIEPQANEVQNMHDELTQLLKNNYFGDVSITYTKNLLRTIYTADVWSYGTTINADDSVTVNAGQNTSSNPINIRRSNTYTLENDCEAITASCEGISSEIKLVIDTYTILEGETSRYITLTSGSKTFLNVPKGTKFIFYLQVPKGGTVSKTTTLYPQLEFGSVATEYEPYFEPYSKDEFKILRWEKLLGIVPLPQGEDDLKTWLLDRQETIVARLYHTPKLNTKSIADVVSIFTGGTATSYFKDGTIHILISPPKDNKQYKFENVEQELKYKIPAHLALSVKRNYATWEEVMNNYSDWNDIKNSFATWEDVYLYVAQSE